MKQTFVQRDLDQASDAVFQSAGHTDESLRPSYHPTSWQIVNRVLDIVDEVSNGRAGWVQRFFSFAFIGGLAALVNLAVFYVMYNILLVKDINDPTTRNIVAYLFACELSLLANFIPNDYFTFRHLPGSRQRTWGARCVRYHITSLSGSLLTFLIQFAFTYFAHLQPIIGEAIALIIVVFYNFSFHHIFTYSHKKQIVTEPLSAESSALDLAALVEVDVLKAVTAQDDVDSVPMI